MAVIESKRSVPLAQPARRRLNPQPRHSQTRHPQTHPQTKDPQLKSELFEAIRHLNRGFGVALSSLDSLQRKDRLQTIFPPDFLLAYRNRTEELRALANRDLLRILAGREEHEVGHYGRLCAAPEKPHRKRRRSRS
jgi:hypothetical protein